MTEDQRLMLLATADVVEYEVADEEFKLNYWSCGTVACAVGHATTRIPELGLGLAASECGVGREVVHPRSGKRSWEAVKEAFGLTYTEAVNLFWSEAYVFEEGDNQRLVVARRIRDFAKEA